jgi:ABC-2 type transport system permease protein
MNALSIALKDLLIFVQDRGAVMQLFLLPLVFIVVASGALGAMGQGDQDTRIELAVVDLDGGRLAQDFVAALDDAGGVRVKLYEEEQASALMESNQLGRVLTVPTAFSSDVQDGRPVTLRLVNHPDAKAEQTEAVRLVVEGVARDMALELQILAALEQMSEMMADSPPEQQEAFSFDIMQAQARTQFERAAEVPLVSVLQRVPAQAADDRGSEMLNTSTLAVPGMAVLFVFLTAQATAHSIYEEKKCGSFRRLLASPISRVSLLAGKLLPNLITALVQMGVILAFGAFGLRLMGLYPASLGNDPLALLLVVLLIALCSSALGIVIVAFARTENQVGGLSSLFLWVAAIVGGSIIPLFALERFLGPLPRIVPHYWANRALEGVMLRGASLAGVTGELFMLAGFTAVFVAMGLWRFDFD